jgi:hypothetical protein
MGEVPEGRTTELAAEVKSAARDRFDFGPFPILAGQPSLAQAIEKDHDRYQQAG